MHVVGIDTHKATLAACAVDERGLVLAERTFPNEPAGFAALAGWLGELGGIERIGLEGLAGSRPRSACWSAGSRSSSPTIRCGRCRGPAPS